VPRQVIQFDPPERFVAGTVGEPGQRTFFLQARDAARLASVVVEKEQVALLAERLDALLDEGGEHAVEVGRGAAVGPLLRGEPLEELVLHRGQVALHDLTGGLEDVLLGRGVLVQVDPAPDPLEEV
jgi:uncharacterized repeat protein (TIGR03847 family)